MDRASDYGSEGWGFDSLPARKIFWRKTFSPFPPSGWVGGEISGTRAGYIDSYGVKS